MLHILLTQFKLFSKFSIAHGIECIQCSPNSPFKNDCTKNPKSANLKHCDANTGDCYTLTYRDEILRGCIGDKIVQNRDSCVQTEFTNCQICSDRDLCNDSPTENCYSDYQKNDKLMSIKCSVTNKKSMGCYTRISSNIGNRYGCMSNLSQNEQKHCLNNNACTICNKDNCNKSFRKCFVCNSQDDLNCVKTTDRTWTESCEPTQLKCVTGLDIYGVTHRRCANIRIDDSIQFLGGFSRCKTDNCNSAIIQAKHHMCYINNNVVQDELHYCKFYMMDDQCYSFNITTESGMILININFFFVKKLNEMLEHILGLRILRGCMSDNDIFKLGCDVFSVNCTKCATNACNKPIELKIDETSTGQKPIVKPLDLSLGNETLEDANDYASQNQINSVVFVGFLILCRLL